MGVVGEGRMEIYKKLIVWQKAMELIRIVYRLFKSFPSDERYALVDQLRRAVVSIPPPLDPATTS